MPNWEGHGNMAEEGAVVATHSSGGGKGVLGET